MTSQHSTQFTYYTESWENKDLPQFLACLADEIIYNWHFHYVYQGQASVFEGLSQVAFSDTGKIVEIKEYKMAFDKTRPYLASK